MTTDSSYKSFQIETHRLILRPFQIADASFLLDLNNDPQVLKHTDDRPFKDLLEAQNFIKNYANYRLDGYGRWTVILKDSLCPIGWCGLKKHPDFVDLGYRFLSAYWGNGYATEAANASVHYGFETLKLKKIIGRVLDENEASKRVLQRLNFSYWKKDVCDSIENVNYFVLNSPYSE